MGRTAVKTSKKPTYSSKKTVAKSKSSKVSKKMNKETDADNMERDDSRILVVKTVHTPDFKKAVEVISNYVVECSIVFVQSDNVTNDNDDEFFEEIEDEETDYKSKKKKSSKYSDDESDDSDEESDDDSEDESEESSEEPVVKKKKSKQEVNVGGIRIIKLSEDKSILIKLKLDACNFNEFYCGEPKITIGVDMQKLNTMLKTINDEDPIMMYMLRNNRSVLYIKSLSEDMETSEKTDLEVYLMEIPNPSVPVHSVKFENIITMDSSKFHTFCKQLHANSVFVEIASIGNEILFNGNNENGKITKTFQSSNHKKGRGDQVVQGMYELKNLTIFSKCKQMSDVTEIYLKNDFPLVLASSVATLGKLYVFLTPIVLEQN